MGIAMKIVRAFALIALMVATAGIRPAAAQGTPSPETLAAARELVALISQDTVREMVDRMLAQIWPTIERGLRAKQPNITAEQIAELRQEHRRIFLEYMANLMDDAPALYARHFSADEMHQLIVFYRSPIGQKSLHVLPQLTAELFTMIIPRLQQVQAQINAAFIKVLRQRGLSI
jgi:hypothetical protein